MFLKLTQIFSEKTLKLAPKVGVGLVAFSLFLSLTPLVSNAQSHRYERNQDPSSHAGQQGNQRHQRAQRNQKGQGQEMRRQKMMEKFGLTPEQMAEFKTLREESKAEAKTIKEELKQKRHAMMEYMQSSDATESEALSMNQEMAQLMSRMGGLRIKTLFKMKNAMTPEQFEKFVAHRKQARQKGQGNNRGHYGGRQGGREGFQGRQRGQEEGQQQGGSRRGRFNGQRRHQGDF